MIITVTLNPLLEYRFSVTRKKTFNDLKQFRSSAQSISAGGKGINVSRQLSYLNINSTAVTFIGGLNGKQFSHALSNEKFSSIFIRTEAETRIGFVTIDEEISDIESYFGMNSLITAKDSDQMKLKLEKMIPNCEMIILSGSSPSIFTNDIFPHAINLANQYDKISVLDTYGAHLGDCIEASPRIVHCTKQEIEDSFSIRLDDEKSTRDFLLQLYQKGIKQAFITNGEEDFYSSNFDYHFKITPPQVKLIDSTGSGDAFTAGIVHGLFNDLVYEEYLTNAVYLGALNAASVDVCAVPMQDLISSKKNISIASVGKKMKTIDVTPTI